MNYSSGTQLRLLPPEVTREKQQAIRAGKEMPILQSFFPHIFLPSLCDHYSISCPLFFPPFIPLPYSSSLTAVFSCAHQMFKLQSWCWWLQGRVSVEGALSNLGLIALVVPVRTCWWCRAALPALLPLSQFYLLPYLITCCSLIFSRIVAFSPTELSSRSVRVSACGCSSLLLTLSSRGRWRVLPTSWDKKKRTRPVVIRRRSRPAALFFKENDSPDSCVFILNKAAYNTPEHSQIVFYK